MANKEHLEILKSDSKNWNSWREENPEVIPDLSEANLFEVNLDNFDLSNTDFSRTNLSEATLRKADLTGAKLVDTKLTRTDFSGARIDSTLFTNAIFDKTKFVGATIFWSGFEKVRLNEADFSRASFERSMVSGVDFSHTRLVGANFNDGYLDNTVFYKANLTAATFNGIYSSDADFTKANLSGTDFSFAPLVRPNFSEAILKNAKFFKTSLFRANFSRANLEGVDFTEATAGYTQFEDVDLSQVKGLDVVKHTGPSYIDFHTLYRSKDRIARAFLQGIGLPDNLINQTATLTNSTIYQSCYISYVQEDKIFAGKLFADLQKAGIRCWFVWEFKDARKWEDGDYRPEEDDVWPSIFQPIKGNDRLIFIFSKASLESEWASYQVKNALEKERQWKKEILLPIRLDDGIVTDSRDWIVNINSSHRVFNFEDSYQDIFEQLLDNLKSL